MALRPRVDAGGSVLGLDVGGASLKFATTEGIARQVYFPLWRRPDRLAEELRSGAPDVPGVDVALTMTGELCDCFRSKADGVRHILGAVESAFPNRAIHVYLTTDEFVTVASARERPWDAAASNWMALARQAGPLAGAGRALLVDIGSTTTDIIPLRDGIPCPLGRNDPQRLASRELCYQGVRRTPVLALLNQATIDGRSHGLCAELFATTGDAYLVLDKLPERPDDQLTADGRPFTKEFAVERLARMIGSDGSQFSLANAKELASQVRDAQRRAIADAARRVIASMNDPIETVVLSGEGEFLWNDLEIDESARPRSVSLASRLGPVISRCACAFAVANLARSRHLRSRLDR